MPDEPSAPDESPDATEGLRPAYRRAYEAARRAAKNMLSERFRLVRLVRRAHRKVLREEDSMGSVRRDLVTLLRLMLFWAKGDYRQVSPKALLSIVGAVLYFVSPIDAIPDFIPVAGLADDVAVVAAVVRAVRGDLDRFRQWENERDVSSTDENVSDANVVSESSARRNGAASS